MSQNKRKPLTSVLPYLQDYRCNSILVKSFFLISVLLVSISAILLVAVSKKMFGVTADEAVQSSMHALEKTKDRIEGAMDQTAAIAGQLCLDADVMAFLLPDTNALAGKDPTAKVQDKLGIYCGVLKYIDSIYIYSHKSNFVISNDGGGNLQEFDDATWYQNDSQSQDDPPRIIRRQKYANYPNLISYIHPIRLSKMQFLGEMIINIDVDQVEQALLDNLPDFMDHFIIADNRSNIIFSTNRQQISPKMDDLDFFEHIDLTRDSAYAIDWADGQPVLTTALRSQRIGWQYIARIPLNKYGTNHAYRPGFYVWVSICCVCFCFIAAGVISIYCYRPIRNILHLLKEPALPEDGYWQKQGACRDEAGEIALTIVRNLHESQQMQKEMKRYSDIVNKAQLTALQAQISPHFLFNTLENIRWRAIADCKGDNAVAQIILKLSDLLRISMDNEQHLITIEQEICNTKLYIDILQARYEGKIKVEWDVDEAALGYPIVKVSLQPIIENAVYHGIKPLRKQGVIRITISKKQSSVFIQIQDNGIGLSADKVEKINQNLMETYVLHEDHIGIMNVNQRLKLLMGSEVEMKISSVPNAGTSVTYVIPALPQEMMGGRDTQAGEDGDAP